MKRVRKDLIREQPLFEEFCRIKDLQPGDPYSPEEFTIWANSLDLTDLLKIIKLAQEKRRREYEEE